jgi:hypothetical protein
VYYRAGDRKNTLCAPIGTGPEKKRKKPNQIHEADGSSMWRTIPAASRALHQIPAHPVNRSQVNETKEESTR